MDSDNGKIPLSNTDTEQAPAFRLPPHLVARFTKVRNRRRSSVSSTKSGSSSQSHSRPTQRHHSVSSFSHDLASTRRISFLESRKARLAARNAQVDFARAQVKNRGQNLETTIAEREAAVQQARADRLAKIAENCAEEVKRAKSIAEKVKEKREEEDKARRDEVFGKLEAVEKRRVELAEERKNRRRRRSSESSPDARAKNITATPLIGEEDKKILDDLRQRIAARLIKSSYKAYKAKATIRAFTSLGLTIEQVRGMAYEAVTEHLRKPNVLSATTGLLRLAGILEKKQTSAVDDISSKGKQSPTADELAVRMLLSAYVILGHPAQVLNNGPQERELEQALISKSTDLLIALEAYLASANPLEPPLDLQMAFDSFSQAFNSWKMHDSKYLLATMIAQYAELDLILYKLRHPTTPGVAPVTEVVEKEYQDGIRGCQETLYIRIRRLVGGDREKVRKLLSKAIRETRAKRGGSKPKIEEAPRGLDAVAETSTSPMSDIEAAAEAASRAAKALADLAALTRSDMAARTASPFPDTDSIMSTPPSSRPHTPTPSSYNIPMRSLLPPNRVLAHELAIDPAFRIQPQLTQLEQQLKETATRAFFDKMRSDLIAGQAELWIPLMAETLRRSMLRVVREGSSVAREVEEATALDAQMVKTVVEAHGLRGWVASSNGLWAWIASWLARVCAPSRDPEVASWAAAAADAINTSKVSEEDAIDSQLTVLSALLLLLDKLHLDLVNFTIASSAPLIVPRAAEYERACFADDLSQGTFIAALPHTRVWLATAARAAWEEARRRNPEGINWARNAPSREDIWWTAWGDLLFGPELEHQPEIFHLDGARIAATRANVQSLVKTAAACMTTKQLLRLDPRRPLPARFVNGVQAIVVAGGGERDEAYSTTSPPPPKPEELLPLLLTASPANEQQILQVLRSASDLVNPLTRLLAARLRTFLIPRLRPATPVERARLAASATAELGAMGMGESVEGVMALLEQAGRWESAVRAWSWEGWVGGLCEEVRKQEGKRQGVEDELE